MSFNLATILTESALSHPGKVAFISGANKLTSAEIEPVDGPEGSGCLPDLTAG